MAPKLPGSAADPLWYKDAVLYELHVRTFADSNDDGIGDFRGLMSRLDYLQDLGVTCLWLLPFFPSPLRDDGYDIADYVNVHPDYGTLEDFQALLGAAHERGLQVMIELVVNHTSDRHAWFQRARLAPPGSPEREFYVWSDTDEKYPGVRIIFTDTEKSNWTWDPVAKAYYWHRFFSHQPDLNFDSPAVIAEVVKAMQFWLDMGVDGLRLDAIPYLVERDGTSCENLPETHAVIKRIREAMDARYAHRVILAEANQWPADVRPYFGDGDECHMAFHFPLMPRIFMALRLEDSAPITEVMAQTPDIPASCQWALFLRNHDELTLEMVTSEERDYMYFAYSADPRMRINVGIRRRLAPLVDNNRRRIELLNSLLFSFPGTPVIYYGDEIGMGDNIYLGDRNGVRTPMQWNGDRNAGFSRANPARLYSPVIMDPVYGYEVVNVEAQQSDQSSLLHWMRNMIALRKLFRVFGRGTLEFLETGNRKVLAYLRRHEHEVMLCIANLSRFAQPVQLDLSVFEGVRPVEMLGYVEFPAIGTAPYVFTPGPYGFLWFELTTQVASEVPVEAAGLSVEDGWDDLFGGEQRGRLEGEVLPRFLSQQRWFGGKARRMVRTALRDWIEVDSSAVVVLVDVEYATGAGETYCVPLALSFDGAEGVPVVAIVGAVHARGREGVLYDGGHHDPLRAAMLRWIEQGETWRGQRGVLRATSTPVMAAARGDRSIALPAVRVGVEQSNSSITYGDRLILKFFRRTQGGGNPDVEITRFLTDTPTFARLAPLAGTIEYVPDDGEAWDLAMLQTFVPNHGDGWAWTQIELARYYEQALLEQDDEVTALGEPLTDATRSRLAPSLAAAATLGRLTAELHLALALPGGTPAFAPEPLGAADMEALAESMTANVRHMSDSLKEAMPTLPDPVVEGASLVLSKRRQMLGHFAALAARRPGGQRLRVHGDYHLGQVLRVDDGYVIIDFEGEPTRPLPERRAKQSPLKDVANMLRSFSYAASAALVQATHRGPDVQSRLEPWAQLWERQTAAAFLEAYRPTAVPGGFLPPDERDFRDLLEAYLVDKACHEVLYELNNRPSWLWIPLRGLAAYGV